MTNPASPRTEWRAQASLPEGAVALHCHIASLPTACTSAHPLTVCNWLLVYSVFAPVYLYNTIMIREVLHPLSVAKSNKKLTACVYLMPFQVQYIRYTLRIRMCVVSIIPIHKSKATCLRTGSKSWREGWLLRTSINHLDMVKIMLTEPSCSRLLSAL